MIRFLSHVLSKDSPSYGNASSSFGTQNIKMLSQGDSCNTFNISFDNHFGTHVDCPAHFHAEGATAASYAAGFWRFNNPQTISVELSPGQLLMPEDLNDTIKQDTDILLLKSGWEEFRGSAQYAEDNPGLSPVFCEWIKAMFKSIRAVGIDWISISAFRHRDAGREAHRIMLSSDSNRDPVLLVEDMGLAHDMSGLEELFIAPLRVEGVDSAPCTVFGIFK